MGIESSRGIKLPGRGFELSPPTNAEVKERVELYLYFPLGLRGLLRTNFTSYLIIIYSLTTII
jgi:hypothetical protein